MVAFLVGRRLRTFGSDSRADDGLDAATDVEVADDFHPARVARPGQVIEDAIDGALVEDAVVAKAPEIQLEALELEADFTWDVGDVDGSEVGRAAPQGAQLISIALDAAKRTERSEFRALHRDLVVAAGIWVGKGLEKFGVGHRERMQGAGLSNQPRRCGRLVEGRGKWRKV